MRRPDAMRAVARSFYVSLQTVYKYYNHFCESGEVFHPFADVIGRRTCPLTDDDVVLDDVHRQMRQTFVTLSMVAQYVNTDLLKDLVKERGRTFDDATVLRWLHRAGYEYKVRRKTINQRPRKISKRYDSTTTCQHTSSRC